MKERNLASDAVSGQECVFLPKAQDHQHLTRTLCFTGIMFKDFSGLRCYTDF